MLKLLHQCRACGNDKLTKVFSLGVQPLANSFRSKDEEQSGYAPLEVLFCERCTLSQLSVVVRSDILYSHYPYITSTSETMKKHFASLWNEIAKECVAESVVEIGSNNGDFLAFCKKHGAERVCGIDPAANLSADCAVRGIRTIIGCFDVESAKMAACEVPSPIVIVARHVFAHIDDWQGFMRSIDVLAKKDTLIVIECPYVLDMLEGAEFDTIYHEHLSYVSVKAVVELLSHSCFHLHKVQKFAIHGGAIVMMIRRDDSHVSPDGSVEEFLSQECITQESWSAFSKAAWTRVMELQRRVENMKSEGRRVVGYGASAKSTVWISACGFTRKEISFIVDNTPHKQGKCSPGTEIPIVPESELTNAKADVAILFSWNYSAEIEAKNAEWVKGGGRFINPHAL